MSIAGVECDPVDIYFCLVPQLTGLATTIFLIVSNHDQLIAPQCGKCWSGHGYIIFVKEIIVFAQDLIAG